MYVFAWYATRAFRLRRTRALGAVHAERVARMEAKVGKMRCANITSLHYPCPIVNTQFVRRYYRLASKTIATMQTLPSSSLSGKRLSSRSRGVVAFAPLRSSGRTRAGGLLRGVLWDVLAYT